MSSERAVSGASSWQTMRNTSLGIGRNDPKKPANPERVVRQHEAFVALVQACADATGEVTVRAVLTFLQRALPTPDTLPADFDPAATLTFRVVLPGSPEGVLPIGLSSVQEFWASYVVPAEAEACHHAMSCIVCGKVGPVLERHPLKIRGIPGGQPSGLDLISANADAFLRIWPQGVTGGANVSGVRGGIRQRTQRVACQQDDEPVDEGAGVCILARAA